MSIAPGAWLGLLGGGQLGRMFTMAAQSMGYKILVLDPGADGPAISVADDHITADYLDRGALSGLASRCAAATTEFENVPADSLRFLAERCVVSPAATSVAVAQDRIAEKRFLRAIGLDIAPYATLETSQELEQDLSPLVPGILKRSRLGYDGKGQRRVNSVREVQEAFESFGGEPCVLERLIALDVELSVVVARGFDGEITTYPVAENQHSRGILDVSIVPARVPVELAAAARDAAIAVATSLQYRGVLCVEFFVDCSGRLLANEIAPRPHNSGHYTIDACFTSQFEQQVRMLCGQPLGDTGMHCPAVMVNLLGDLWRDGEPRWEHVLCHPRAKLHLYGKAQARSGRKMGHYTVLDTDGAAALATALEIRNRLCGLAEAGALPTAVSA